MNMRCATVSHDDFGVFYSRIYIFRWSLKKRCLVQRTVEKFLIQSFSWDIFYFFTLSSCVGKRIPDALVGFVLNINQEWIGKLVTKMIDELKIKCPHTAYWCSFSLYLYPSHLVWLFSHFLFLSFLSNLRQLSKSNEHTVTLRSVPRLISGKYQCEVSADAPLFHTETSTAKMLVAELPAHNPVLSMYNMPNNSKNGISVGELLKATCVSGPSYPPGKHFCIL